MHIHSTSQLHSLVFKIALNDKEFPTSQDILVGICGRFFFETLWELGYLSAQMYCGTDESDLCFLLFCLDVFKGNKKHI